MVTSILITRCGTTLQAHVLYGTDAGLPLEIKEVELYVTETLAVKCSCTCVLCNDAWRKPSEHGFHMHACKHA